MSEKWQEVEQQLGPSWTNEETEPGHFVTGVLEDIQPLEFGDNYVLRDARINGRPVEGGKLLVWGKAILRRKMAEVLNMPDVSMPDGPEVKIVYDGDIKTKSGRTAQNFSVFTKQAGKPDAKPASAKE